MKHSIYGYKDSHGTGFVIDLLTRRIKFQYIIGDSDDGIRMEFGLLLECVDWAQKKIKKMLKEDKIEIMTVEDGNDFYTIVTNSTLPFEK